MPDILGLSSHHDAGATLLDSDGLVAAVNEERFSREKHDASFPFRSIDYCLKVGDIAPQDLDAIAIPTEGDIGVLSDVLGDPKIVDISVDPPSLRDSLADAATRAKHLADRPDYLIGRAVERVTSSLTADDRLRIPAYLNDLELSDDVPVMRVNHHEAHARTAYHGFGGGEALVVTADGIGNRYSTTIWDSHDGEMEPLRRWGRQGSLGWFYGIVTEGLGWWIGNGEGKTMGLASYGEYDDEVAKELSVLLPRYDGGELVDGVEFSRPTTFTIRGTDHWSFRESDDIESLIERYNRETVAATAQRLLEDQIMEIVSPWLDRTGHDRLATAGGVFLNVRVNNRVIREIDPTDYFMFPNAGDGGLPTGAVYSAACAIDPGFESERLGHTYYGPSATEGVPDRLDERLLEYEIPDDIAKHTATILSEGGIVAWCQGRMEYGPRALGNRSILIDPTREDSMDRVNRAVKFRDSWRPFAPSIKEAAVDDYLVDPVYDPFMITSCDVRPEKRDEIPAVTHVDGSTRPQVVRRTVNERYWRLLDAFEDMTGTPVLLNTSFNLSGDPIVCDVHDAIQTFYDCGLDALVIGDHVLTKRSG